MTAPSIAISTGIYGYPPDEAAEVAVSTIMAMPTAVDLVRLVAFDAGTLARYRPLVDGLEE